MRRLDHPRTVVVAALLTTLLGVVGESVDGSALLHLFSVVCVVLGLVVVVLTLPGFGQRDHDDV